MGVAEITAGAAVLQALIKAWDRWKERRHERWKMRKHEELRKLREERSEIDMKIEDVALRLNKDAAKVARENQTC